MSNNKGNGGIFAGKGYYIALILCAAAIGITSYVYYRNTDTVKEISLQEETYAEPAASPLGTEDVPVLATEPPVSAPAPSTRPSETPAPTEKKVLKTASPIPGEPIVGYSMEALSYNQTTRDWRVHDGVDIAAEPGTQVCAAAEGEVTEVYEDDAYGYTVVIRHIDGYTTCYSSLDENVTVKAGDKVSLGQVIGCASDSAIVETTLGSHIHFSVTCNGESLDPAVFLALGK